MDIILRTSSLNSPCAGDSRYGSLRNSKTGWCESLLKEKRESGEVRRFVGGYMLHINQQD